jgi:predicted HTH transcriptional regulator
MTALPVNLADIESLVRNKVQESIHLDYKASPALDPKKSDEIAKDVSAFANSDGGLLIYGVEEDKASHLPVQIDAGVNPKWNREWLEQVITSNISPRIEGVEVAQFELPTGRYVVCVRVPKSFRGPHQASDNKYYKRFNFSAFPMEHYEVEDTRSRRQALPSLVALDLGAPGGGLFEFSLQNVGQAAALDLSFKCQKI